MKLLVLLGMVLMAGLHAARAADAGVGRQRVEASATVYRVIPRSPAAELVWASDACWRGCAMECGRNFKVCLSVGESCISQNNACDRACQRQCRRYGGPLLPIDW